MGYSISCLSDFVPQAHEYFSSFSHRLVDLGPPIWYIIIDVLGVIYLLLLLRTHICHYMVHVVYVSDIVLI